uniref:Uncharacterized protein n=1 Tax=Sphaerodactylus townsendi TaxID=933632 RepID=A0ACB8FTT0_9SAUR
MDPAGTADEVFTEFHSIARIPFATAGTQRGREWSGQALPTLGIQAGETQELAASHWPRSSPATSTFACPSLCLQWPSAREMPSHISKEKWLWDGASFKTVHVPQKSLGWGEAARPGLKGALRPSGPPALSPRARGKVVIPIKILNFSTCFKKMVNCLCGLFYIHPQNIITLGLGLN